MAPDMARGVARGVARGSTVDLDYLSPRKGQVFPANNASSPTERHWPAVLERTQLPTSVRDNWSTVLPHQQGRRSDRLQRQGRHVDQRWSKYMPPSRKEPVKILVYCQKYVRHRVAGSTP